MFDRREPKIFYNAKLLRVMITLRQAHVLTQEHPPVMLLEKTEARLLRERTAGNIGHFEIFDTRFFAFWQRLRQAPAIAQGSDFVFTLASAAPPEADIFVEKMAGSRESAGVTVIDARKRWKLLSLNTFKFAVRLELKRAGFKGFFDPACIHYAYIKLLKDGLITDFPLTTMDASVATGSAGRPYRLMIDESRQRISLLLFDLQHFNTPPARQHFFHALTAYAAELSSGKDLPFIVLDRHLKRSLATALIGPERLGIDLPSVMLAAYRLQKEEFPTQNRRKNYTMPWRTPGPWDPPHACPFHVTIAGDGMHASVSAKGDLLALYPGALDEAWWRDHLHHAGVTHGIDPLGLGRLLAQIQSGENIDNIVVAHGQSPVPARDPELKTMTETPRAIPSDDLATLNFRYEASRMRYARLHDEVAHVVYATPARPGKTVRGAMIPPTRGETFSAIAAGQGIQRRDATTFVALYDGTLQINDTSIWLERSLVIDGDIKLTSGDVNFDGPVEIKGNVEAGSSVICSGDLLIHGMVSSAFVVAHKGMLVKGGIIGGGKTIIRVKGDLSAGFIENASVICHGSIKVARGIVGGTIAGGRRIEAKGDGGLIAGGEIYCQEEILCQNLGRADGATTKVTMGRSFLWQIAYDRRLKRIHALRGALLDTRAMLNSILTRSSAQLTKTHVKVRARLTERLANIHTLLEKMRPHAKKALDRIIVNPNAKIHVIDTLSQNVRMKMGDFPVVIPSDVKAITVLTTKTRGEQFIPLDPAVKSPSPDR